MICRYRRKARYWRELVRLYRRSRQSCCKGGGVGDDVGMRRYAPQPSSMKLVWMLNELAGVPGFAPSFISYKCPLTPFNSPYSVTRGAIKPHRQNTNRGSIAQSRIQCRFTSPRAHHDVNLCEPWFSQVFICKSTTPTLNDWIAAKQHHIDRTNFLEGTTLLRLSVETATIGHISTLNHVPLPYHLL